MRADLCRAEDHSLPGYFLSQGDTSGVGAGGRLQIGFKPDNTFEMSFYDGVSLVVRNLWPLPLLSIPILPFLPPITSLEPVASSLFALLALSDPGELDR